MALSVHKKGQGTAARGVAGVVAVLMGCWAAHSMYVYMLRVGPTAQIIGAAVIGLAFGGVPVYLVLFHRQVVDLLIETQQEMRKVAWSTRQEVIGSTIVVLFTVAVLALFILGMDLFVNVVFKLIGLLR